MTMDNNGGRKVTGIRRIVRLKKILQKWQSVTLPQKRKNYIRGCRAHGGISPAISRRLRSSNVYGDKHPAMDDNGRRKATGIWQIVRLKKILQIWHSATLRRRKSKKIRSGRTHGAISPAISRRLRISDLDEESCYSPEPPQGVPKGYLAVYVGLELRRFIIPTSHLGHPLFKVLLEKTEEEFGFDHSGGLTIACETEIFKYLLKCIENHQKHQPKHDVAGTCANHWRVSEYSESLL
ncbi:uncharacterized protein LOC132276022 [Cornus florida]|uniref:uncharacterized protein LOC132276022 n=1 Tax=Cornus florida TaxID=4283 RepID=UPI0028A22431|nr:uncharacterized protein LOC132276022 [Cornus florida]